MKKIVSFAFGLCLALLSATASAGLFDSTETELTDAINAKYAEGYWSANVYYAFGFTPVAYTTNYKELAKRVVNDVPLAALEKAGLIEVSKPQTFSREAVGDNPVFGVGLGRPDPSTLLQAITPTAKGKELLKKYLNSPSFMISGAKMKVVEFTEPSPTSEGKTTTVTARMDISGIEPKMRELLLAWFPDVEKSDFKFVMVKTNKGWSPSPSGQAEKIHYRFEQVRNTQKRLHLVQDHKF